ncbi:MAG TPA: DUF4082 domain-containing protein [Gemmatales bacterium]|nr:DUF4082 domain-containing protein [Gemmatales bacterium]
MRKVVLAFSLGLTIILGGGFTKASAQTIGLTTVTDPNNVNNNGDWVLGYSFLVNSSISVVSLGVYDHNSDGLLGSHDVGLWDSSGNLLASSTVPAGTGATLDSSYRFVTISAVNLSPGSTYYVGAVKVNADQDEWIADPLSFATAPEISYDSRRFQFYSGTLVFPDLAGSNSVGYFGGNFQFAAVPEPTTWALMGVGASLAGLSAWRMRKRKTKVQKRR